MRNRIAGAALGAPVSNDSERVFLSNRGAATCDAASPGGTYDAAERAVAMRWNTPLSFEPYSIAVAPLLSRRSLSAKARMILSPNGYRESNSPQKVSLA